MSERIIAARLSLWPHPEQYTALERMLAAPLNSPACSSLGRLFDSIASLLGIRSTVNFEGQAAMELEAAADEKTSRTFPFEIEIRENTVLLNFFPAVNELVKQRLQGVALPVLAAAFHNTVIESLCQTTDRIRSIFGIERAALSGGVFQNKLLLEGCMAGLLRKGFEVYAHQLVPTNDGGISLGQAIAAAEIERHT